jgi:hypothetical protein
MHINHLRLPTFTRRTQVIGAALGLFILLAVAGFVGQPAFAENTGGDAAPFTTVPPGGTIPMPLLSKVTVVHAAPFTSDVSASGVDICTEDNLVVANLSNLKYLDQRATFLTQGEYDWKATQAGSSCSTTLIDIAPFAVANGGEYVLILTGDGTNQPLDSLLVTIEQGGPNVYLPLIYR